MGNIHKKVSRKKAEVAGQVFIYLLTILIMGLMFYFGIKWMGSLMENTDDIELAQIKIDFETSFEKIKSNYGSWKTEEFRVPPETKKVCFLDDDEELTETDKDESGICDKGINEGDDYNPILCDTWKYGTHENIFFDPPINMQIYVGEIEIEGTADPYMCFTPQSGKITIKLTGSGDHVRVSRP